MKKLNKKGFTLIELLAVIVILGILLAIAVPSVTKYINDSRKDTYVGNAQSIANAARNQASMGDYAFPTSETDATLIPFTELANSLDKGGKTSPYGYDYQDNYSYVVIINKGTATEPKYEYYIAAIDSEGYGIGKLDSNKKPIADVISYDDLDKADIVQISSKVGYAVTDNKITINGNPYTITNRYPKTN